MRWRGEVARWAAAVPCGGGVARRRGGSVGWGAAVAWRGGWGIVAGVLECWRGWFRSVAHKMAGCEVGFGVSNWNT